MSYRVVLCLDFGEILRWDEPGASLRTIHSNPAPIVASQMLSNFPAKGTASGSLSYAIPIGWGRYRSSPQIHHALSLMIIWNSYGA